MAAAEAAFVAMVLVMMLSLLFVGWKTPEVVVFLALVLVWNAGIISTDDALSGFNNTGVLAVGSLFVVIKGVERSRLADRAAKQVFGLRTSFTAALLRLMGLAFFLSAFLNNTPVVALLIPITKDWAVTRGFSASLLLMPLSFACIFGGLVTIIGTSTNLVVQGLVKEAGKEDATIEELGFFEPGYIGLPLGLVGMLYLVVAAPRVLPRGVRGGSGKADGAQDRRDEMLTEMLVTYPFSFIGQAVSPVLARLGLPAETLFKIRRKLPLEAGGTVPPHETLIRRDSYDQHRDGGGVCAGIGDEEKTLSERDVDVDVAASSGTLGCRKRLGVGWDTANANDNSTATTAAAATVGATAAARRSGIRPFATRRLSDSDDDLGCNAGATFSTQSVSDQRITGAPLSFDMSPGRCPDTPDTASRGDNEQGEQNSYADIFPVSSLETVRDGDILVLSCPRSTMVTFQASVLSDGVEGVKILGSSVPQLAAQGDSFAELVLADNNRFVGRRPPGIENASFPSSPPTSSSSRYYGCSIVAVRHATAGETCATGGGGGGGGAAAETWATAGAYATAAAAAAAAGSSSPAPPAAATVFTRRRTAGEPLPASGEDTRVSRRYIADRYLDPVGPGEEDADQPLRGERASPELGAVTQETEDAPGRDYSLGVDASRRVLVPGDTVLVLTNEGFVKKWKGSRHFDLVTLVGSVPKPVRTYDYFSLLVFGGMLGWVLFSDVVMVRAAFAAAGVLIVGGWVDAKKSVGYVDWALLLLVGSALGLSKAISNSGLASYAGNAIRESGMSASTSLYVLYGFTMICTELITNNAAAALAVPVALSIAKELEVSYKPFVLTVMMAASSSFITPIGYQTNTMVWAPGGYKFSDFIKLGTPLSLIYLVVGSTLMPRLFPF